MAHNRGATFQGIPADWVRSPETMSIERNTPAPAPPRSADASLSILVVDDESDLREMLTRSFSREGHRVLAVPDGRAAIDRASTDQFDIVLLDVALGAGPDGYEVCRTLRGRRNVVPIIMLTALDSEADAVLGLEAGADDYVTKPFGLAELRSRIRAVLRRSGTRAMGDEVLVVGPISLDRLDAVGDGDHPVPLTGERARQHLPQVGLVVDDEDAQRDLGLAWRRARWLCAVGAHRAAVRSCPRAI